MHLNDKRVLAQCIRLAFVCAVVSLIFIVPFPLRVASTGDSHLPPLTTNMTDAVDWGFQQEASCIVGDWRSKPITLLNDYEREQISVSV